MNGFGSSECSSGCESGWTMYLDHSSASLNPGKSVCGGGDDDDGFFCTKGGGEEMEEDDDEEEEGLSMVSDASSGPPHCHEDDEYYCDENGYFSSSVPSAALLKKSNKRQKTRKPTPPNHLHQQQQHQSLLDDTASSPLFSISKNNSNLKNNQASMENVLDFSQGFSATHFKGRSTFQRHFDFLPGKQTSTKPVGCRKGSGNQLW